MGGVNPEGIKLVLDLEEIEDRPLITQKLLSYLSGILHDEDKDKKQKTKK